MLNNNWRFAQLAVGGWRLAVGGWRLAVGRVAVSGGEWRLAVGGSWGRFAVGGGWQLAFVYAHQLGCKVGIGKLELRN